MINYAGPVTHSKLAVQFGLGVSMLERLVAGSAPYQRDKVAFAATGGYNPAHLTKLVDCYRCHRDIIAIPNALFYDSDLVCKADPRVCKNLCEWAHLPAKGFPLIFHGVYGENTREASSPRYLFLVDLLP